MIDVFAGCFVSYKALNEYIDLDVSSYIQYYSNYERMDLYWSRTMQGLILLSLALLIGLSTNRMCYQFLYGKLQVSLALKGE